MPPRFPITLLSLISLAASVRAADWPLFRGNALQNGVAASEALARRVTQMLGAAGLPTRLADCGVSAGIFPVLAEEAAAQWTGKFNPRPVDEADLRALYEAAL